MVTGASGFVGRALLTRLIEEGHHITALSRHPGVEQANVTWIMGDIRNTETWQRLPKAVDCFIHLSAQISKDVAAAEDREALFDTNVLGTWKALEFCVQAAVPRFVFASSMSVYGWPTQLPVTEDIPLKPLTLYGATKATAEVLVSGYSYVLPGSAIILRFSAIYGPGQRTGVARTFVDRASKGLPLLLTNGGRNTSDFVYIEDVVQALSLAANSNEQGIFNVSSGRETSILQLAEAVQQAAAGAVEIKISDSNEVPTRFFMDNSRATQCLNYRPEYNVTDGMNKWLNALRNRLDDTA